MANTTTVNLEMIRGDTFAFDLILHDIDPASIESLYFTAQLQGDSAAGQVMLDNTEEE